jgi:hypothetical protein
VVTVGGFQLRQPVGVNERAQDTPNFVERGILFPDRPQEPKLYNVALVLRRTGPLAAAAGMCFAAIRDGHGRSTRNPASANGVVGRKPTYGRVSRYGVLVMAGSLDHVGPIARSVADAAIMFESRAHHSALGLSGQLFVRVIGHLALV